MTARTNVEPMSGPNEAPARARAGPIPLSSDEAHVWCARLDVSPATSASLYTTLSVDERSRSARLRFGPDRQRFITAHGALREVLGRYLRAEPGRIRYVYGAFGKPQLGPEFGGWLEFNLSHSAGLALIAVAAASPLGIDLEHIGSAYDHEEIARCFFSAAEVHQLRGLSGDRRAAAFLSFWTKKEAYLKARGDGLTELIADPAHGPVELGGSSDDGVQATGWSAYALQPAPGYVGTLVIAGNGWRVINRQWGVQEG